uniref:NAD(P)-dependent oxidoreductase n=1 Tax=Algoriphagus boseongensis TaxID=1442587 RepID=UPI001060C95C|nr:NAD(P)-dependent oxidoreductase [Algoriphagus boseongensis]
MKIGIIREGKNPPDKRVPFTPTQIKELILNYGEDLEFLVESSPNRCFDDQEYIQAGVRVVNDVSEADILFGVKEVPISNLLPEKTYFFFSHTIKKQAYNRPLLKAILAKNIRLIDYEALKNEEGNRVVAFGRWAGIVGAYNALWTYGQKTGLYEIERARNLDGLSDLLNELKKIQLPPIKIIVIGTGRVGKGIKEILGALGIQEVSAHDFIHSYYEEPVFVVLKSEDFNRRKSDGGFDKEEFYSSPEKYESHFQKFAEVGEVLIGGGYWNPGAPRLFTMEDIKSPDFSISVIADITCDIRGSIPTTIRASTITDPIYDIERESGAEIPAFGSQTSISVMAIDNLPCELPRESSEEFGRHLSKWVIPALFEENSPILERATVTRDGDLTLEFMYLMDFVNQEE